MSKSTRASLRNESFGGLPPVRMGQRVILAASSLRSRAGALASTQLRGAAGELLAGALGKLDARVRGSASPAPSLERMREVLERDRALAFAEHAVAPGPPLPPSRGQVEAVPADIDATRAPSPSTTSNAPKAELCNEPIRTRTLARLLAAQGHRERALSIYAYLLDHHPSDVALIEEASALRANEAASS